MPHAVLATGHPRGAGLAFAEGLTGLVFGESTVERLRQHVDIRWIEPEGKARMIKVDAVENLMGFIGLTSYGGVILFADRLNEPSQNKLLKTLEEPPPNSLLVLVTDAPAALLPTIRSRVQAVDVMEDERPEDVPWWPAVIELMRHPPARRACEMIAWTDRLTAPLRSLDELAEAEETAKMEERARSRAEAELTTADKTVIEGRVATRVKEMREEIFRAIQLWQRDVLARVQGAEAAPAWFPEEADAIAAQAEGLAFADALRRVRAVDEVRELLEHNIRESVALLRLARAVSRPAG